MKAIGLPRAQWRRNFSRPLLRLILLFLALFAGSGPLPVRRSTWGPGSERCGHRVASSFLEVQIIIVRSLDPLQNESESWMNSRDLTKSRCSFISCRQVPCLAFQICTVLSQQPLTTTKSRTARQNTLKWQDSKTLARVRSFWFQTQMALSSAQVHTWLQACT